MKCRFCYLILHLNLTSEKHSKTNLYTNIDWYLNYSHNPRNNTPGQVENLWLNNGPEIKFSWKFVTDFFCLFKFRIVIILMTNRRD
jgi:hypothetical protein